MQPAEKYASCTVFQIMPDQPDCCGKCGSRLELMEIVMINDEHLFVSFCDECQREVLTVED
jgi:hypothetical protein